MVKGRPSPAGSKAGEPPSRALTGGSPANGRVVGPRSAGDRLVQSCWLVVFCCHSGDHRGSTKMSGRMLRGSVLE